MSIRSVSTLQINKPDKADLSNLLDIAVIINNTSSHASSLVRLLGILLIFIWLSRPSSRIARNNVSKWDSYISLEELSNGNVGGNWSSAGSLLFNTSGLRPREPVDSLRKIMLMLFVYCWLISERLLSPDLWKSKVNLVW